MNVVDEEFAKTIEAINTGKSKFSEDEQNIIDSWVSKLSEPKETDNEKAIRNEYARVLDRLINKEKQIWHPFAYFPPEGDLMPLCEINSKYKNLIFNIKKMPCPAPKRGQDTIPKKKKTDKSALPFDDFVKNEFEDPEEMAKTIARSKGQTFTEFVGSISRHTSDFGQELLSAMKTETNSFKDYVDHVLSLRIKDLTEVLDEEQNRELQKIKKDIERWQLELSNVKRRIREIIPDFDLDLYRKDKNYLKKIFTVEKSYLPDDDPFKRWKEENCHRLKWISDMTRKVIHDNKQTSEDIRNIKGETLALEGAEACKQQDILKGINCEISEYRKLKLERDKLHRENAELLWKLQEIDH